MFNGLIWLDGLFWFGEVTSFQPDYLVWLKGLYRLIWLFGLMLLIFFVIWHDVQESAGE